MSNKNHPELNDNEMFLANGTEEFYNSIGYKTKRIGEYAFDTSNILIPNNFGSNNLYPIFVQISEFNKVQNELNKYYNIRF